MSKLKALHPQYVTDEKGRRTSVILPIGEFEELLSAVKNLADLAESQEPSPSEQAISLSQRRAWMKLPPEERRRCLAAPVDRRPSTTSRRPNGRRARPGKGETLSNPDTIPKRGEIWLVNLAPTIGAEIKKVRPAVVVSSNAIGRLPIKLVAPLSDWKEYFAHNVWHVRVNPTPATRLSLNIPEVG